MDKYGKWVVVLLFVTAGLMVMGDLAYAKYRANGHRLPSELQAA